MRTIRILEVLCASLVGCAGFYVAPVVPPPGFVYTEYRAPVDIDAANSPITGKRGTAYSENILGLVAWGDASVKAAADSAGIRKVEHIDYEVFNVLGVYSKFSVVVYGE